MGAVNRKGNTVTFVDSSIFTHFLLLHVCFINILLKNFHIDKFIIRQVIVSFLFPHEHYLGFTNFQCQ